MQKVLSVSHASFREQRLEVLSRGWFSGPKVLLNGSPVKKSKGAYRVLTDNGEEIPVRLAARLGDPVPALKVGEDLVHLAAPLKWYEYGWAALPILLMFAGGALGALAGMLGSYANFRVFRSDLGTFSKYGIAAGVSLLSLVTFLVSAIALRVLIGR